MKNDSKNIRAPDGIFSSFMFDIIETEQESRCGRSKFVEFLDLNLDVKKYTLENGLRLLVVENDRLPIMSYYTFYDVGEGSNLESVEQRGRLIFLNI